MHSKAKINLNIQTILKNCCFGNSHSGHFVDIALSASCFPRKNWNITTMKLGLETIMLDYKKKVDNKKTLFRRFKK